MTGRELPEREQVILDDLVDLLDARAIERPLPRGRVVDRVEGRSVVVELVDVSSPVPVRPVPQ